MRGHRNYLLLLEISLFHLSIGGPANCIRLSVSLGLCRGFSFICQDFLWQHLCCCPGENHLTAGTADTIAIQHVQGISENLTPALRCP